MVKLVHAMVRLGVDEASPDGNKKSRQDKHDGGEVNGDHGPPPHDPVDERRKDIGARLVPAEVGVVDDVLEGVEKDNRVVFCLHLVAKRGVLFHVVVELVEVALLQQPRLILTVLVAGNIRLV